MNVINRKFFNFAVVNVPMAQVIEAFAGLFHPVLSRPTPLIFPQQSHQVKEGAPPLLLWSPISAPRLTAFMPQVASGDYFVVSYAHERFGFPLVSVRSTGLEESHPLHEFAVYEGKGVKPRRLVRVMLGEPKWDFYTEGEPLPFENLQAYRAQRIRDRFSSEMLVTYVEQWGAPVRSADFWRSAEDAITLVRTRCDR
jgi:hypothetical protein